MAVLGFRKYVFILMVLVSGSCAGQQESDQAKAASLKTLSVEQLIIRVYEDGDMDSQFELGLRYENGVGISHSLKEALYWFSTAGKQGHAGGQNRVGLYYKKFGDQLQEKGNTDKSSEVYSKAFDLLEDSASKGHSEAQNTLGIMYFNGSGVDEDKVEAIKWFRKSAAQGNSKAWGNLAHRYQRGEGVEKDIEEAIRLFIKASELGSKQSMHDLGALYYNGIGGKKDINKGLEWFDRACKSGFNRSCSAIFNIKNKKSPNLLFQMKQKNK